MQVLIILEARGKIPAWSRIATAVGVKADIVVTSGHFSRFPDRLMPLGIQITKGQAIDAARVPRPEIDLRLRTALKSCTPQTEIWIATDDDPEGDVIAMDVVQVIFDVNPALVESCLRLRARALTRNSVERAIKVSRDLGGDIDNLLSNAVAGRTRALTDRWMGATFSRMTQAGCGRVRAGILGMALCWARVNSVGIEPEVPGQNKLLLDLPETGEITFQARSSSGGLPFTAHVSVSGQVSTILAAVARRYSGRLVPGHVTPLKSVGAAVAPRFKKIGLFNTGDVLAYASRFHGVNPKVAMAGLQSAYMQGRISYPRTEYRTISADAAVGVVQVARVCGLRDVDMRHAGRHAPEKHTEASTTIHEGIYPTPRMTKDDLDQFRALVLKPVREVDSGNHEDVKNLMITLVARRAFEALRDTAFVPGNFHPRDDSDLTREERSALSDLEWTRADGANMPWGRVQMTGLRFWPLASVIIDGMMGEKIGRASTLASHASLVEASGQLRIPEPGALPEPSQEGRRILKALPQGMQVPRVCRMIGETLYKRAPDENGKSKITVRMRDRIDVWFKRMSVEIRTALVDILKSDAGRDGRMMKGMTGISDISAIEVDPELEVQNEESASSLEPA